MGARFDRFRVATGATLRARYGRSMLGVAWLPIAPVVLVATLVLALSRILGQTEPALQLVLGLILWNFFAGGTSEGLSGLASRKGLIATAGRSAGAVMAATLVPHLLELGVALVTLVVCQTLLGAPPAWLALAAALPVVELVLLTYGIALTVAALEARLGDVQHGWRLALAVGFWITPIVYPLARLPERYQALAAANPVGRLIEEVRGPMLTGTVAPLDTQLVTVLVVVALCAAGMLLFRRSLPLILERM